MKLAEREEAISVRRVLIVKGFWQSSIIRTNKLARCLSVVPSFRIGDRHSFRDLIHVGAGVFRTYERHDSRSRQRAREALLSPAKQNPNSSPLKSLDDFRQSVHTCRVHERNAPEPDNHRPYVKLRPLDGAFQFLRRTKEEWPIDPINEHAWRQCDVARLLSSLTRSSELPNNSCCTLTDSAIRRMKRSAAITTPTLTATTRSTNTVSPNVIRRTSRSERGARCQEPREMRHVAHVPGHVKEDRRQRRERDVRRPRGEQHDHENQEHRVHDAGEWARGTIADAGRRARDRASRCEPTENWREDVGRTLADQFLVGIVAGAGHAIGDDGSQQRLDRAEKRDCKGWADELYHVGDREIRPVQRR